MPMYKVLVDYPNAEGWKAGDVVDITNPFKLIEEGKVEVYVAPKKEPKAEVVSVDTDSEAGGSKPSKKKSK